MGFFFTCLVSVPVFLPLLMEMGIGGSVKLEAYMFFHCLPHQNMRDSL